MPYIAGKSFLLAQVKIKQAFINNKFPNLDISLNTLHGENANSRTRRGNQENFHLICWHHYPLEKSLRIFKCTCFLVKNPRHVSINSIMNALEATY